MRRYQYDDLYYVVAEDEHIFFKFLDYEDEEAYARYLMYGKCK